jgi:hypothetical protein
VVGTHGRFDGLEAIFRQALQQLAVAVQVEFESKLRNRFLSLDRFKG